MEDLGGLLRDIGSIREEEPKGLGKSSEAITLGLRESHFEVGNGRNGSFVEFKHAHDTNLGKSSASIFHSSTHSHSIHILHNHMPLPIHDLTNLQWAFE